MPVSVTASSRAERRGSLLTRLVAILIGPRIGFVLKLGVSAGLIALVCRDIDVGAFAASLRTQSLAWLAATVLLGLVQIGLLSLRWHMILRALGANSGLVSALAVTFMGCFFGAFMFGPTGGDVARAVLAPPRSLGRRGIVHSVLFERFASTVGLGLAAGPVVMFGAATLARGIPLFVAVATVPLPFLAMAAIGYLARRFAEREGALVQALRELDESLRRLCRCWPRFAIAVAIAALGQFLVAVEAWCLAQSQHLGVSLLDFAILMPPVMLLVALPISAGGWGVRERAMVAALGLVGIGAAPALLLSVELGLIGTLVSLPGGAIWSVRCFSRDASFKSVV
ncbi:MAG TPA: lysylphosphatidylglycerol synthase transmembrane domain-containing protein [Stellaceae bacterium]|nr:lysylphosphatidylglycerol synthase transmembrane domain-containing protein [Stellaceae bacterium]